MDNKYLEMIRMGKYVSFAILFIACNVLMINSNIGQELLTNTWKFKTGDDPMWKNLDLNDNQWYKLKSDETWESQGIEEYDGYAWYRQKIMIPANAKKDIKANGGLILKLGTIDDCDQTFFNGELIGETGVMPPNYKGAYAAKREYFVPIDMLNIGEENVIAVRVYDGGGGGGLYGGNTYLGPPRMEDLVEIDFTGKYKDQIFTNGSNIQLNFDVINASNFTYGTDLSYTLTTDFGEELLTETMPARLLKTETKSIKLELGDLEPGFYQVDIKLVGDDTEMMQSFNIGVSPESIVSPANAQKDFNDYWQRAKDELQCVDPQFKMTLDEDYSTEDNEVYLVEMRSLGNVLVRGFYSKPTKEGLVPAVLQVQGYGTARSPRDLFIHKDMAAFALNIRGHGNSKDNVNPGFPGYLLHEINDVERYIYRGAYMDCIRAMDFLFSQAEVDPERVAVEGGSQGGALSFATAALDADRIALCAPDVPFLSDFPDYIKTAQWPTNEFENYLKEHPETDQETLLLTLSYIDIKNLAPMVKAPVRMAFGLKDKICPPHINFAAYNNLDTSKEFISYPDNGHSLPSVNYVEKWKWIGEKFGVDLSSK